MSWTTRVAVVGLMPLVHGTTLLSNPRLWVLFVSSLSPSPNTRRDEHHELTYAVGGAARSGGARDQTPTVKISPQQSVAPCPLVIQEWEAELRGFEHREKVISWISEGARLGFSGPRSAVQSPPSFLNEQDYKIIMTDIKSEVAAGRILGPFSPDNLATSYHSRTCEYRQSE